MTKRLALLRSVIGLGCCIAVAASLTACSPKSDGEVRAKPTNEPFTVEVPSAETTEVTKKAKITCKESSECPENVALMITVVKRAGDKMTIAQCTSFLVAPDIVATNSHCVPQELRAGGRSCKGKIGFAFASRSGDGARAECEKIISATEIDENQRSNDYLRKSDVAFIKLASKIENVTPHRFDHTGLPDGLRLRVAAIDPVKHGQVEGLLVMRECSTVQGTFASPSYVTDRVSVATAAGCEITKGNSGSPAIDENGYVRAVVFGVLPSEMMAQQLSGYETPPEFQTLTYLSNAACFEVPAGAFATGERESKSVCDRRLNKESLRERARKNANLDLDSTLATWKTTAPALFGYKLGDLKTNGNNALTKVTVPAAVCIKPMKDWPSEKTLSSQLVRFVKTGDAVSASIRVPIWADTYALDELYRVSLRAKTVDNAILDLDFDSKDLETGPVPTVYKVKSEGDTLKAKSSNLRLKICDEGSI